MDALHQACRGGMAGSDSAWALQRALLDHLESVWREPDEGIWEVRGGRRNFTFSKVMAWVAFDRGVKGVEQFGLEGPVDRWRAVRDDIHADICKNGFAREARQLCPVLWLAATRREPAAASDGRLFARIRRANCRNRQRIPLSGATGWSCRPAEARCSRARPAPSSRRSKPKASCCNA